MTRMVNRSRPPVGRQPEAAVQRAVAGALEGLTEGQLRELLPSYGVTDDGEIDKVVEKFRNDAKHQHLQIRSIPQLLERTSRSTYPRSEVEEEVKEDLSGRAPALQGRRTVTLHRVDNRDPETVRKAGGLFGWGVVTIEHARLIAANWQKMGRRQRLDWSRNWKAQTASKSDDLPYVATGTEAQKGGYDYTVTLPLQWEGEAGTEPVSGPQLGADAWPLSRATVLAIKLDDEVILITGIPAKYIKNLNAPPAVPPKPTRLKNPGTPQNPGSHG
ncbi:hypothetical protein [Streptomyces pinistramenti]|uniref:hypothetical protein n=1 Tax=Streptomyces pinistramenti TaxID=2884812 RepID=UPI001D05E34F|nr:hypothetical protein [Streptomyces pinistramenti]MCB5907477.1 hypothetical protein [Streptomyces pinistramenti]